MMFSNRNVEDLQNLNEAVSLQNQVKALRLQDKLGEKNYHEDAKKLFEPMTDAIKDTSDILTKTITESSINNNKAIENSNERILELMNDKGSIAPYLTSSLVNLLKPDNKRQFRFKKELNSTKMKEFLINEGIPVTLFSNMISSRDSNKSFKLDGDLLETKTNYDFKVSHSNPKDQKLIYESGKAMNFNIKQKGRKSDRDRSLIKLLKSPAIMASGISNIKFLSPDPDELCNRLELLLQEKQAGNGSNILNEEIIAIVNKLLECKCITKRQHEQILIKRNLLLI